MTASDCCSKTGSLLAETGIFFLWIYVMNICLLHVSNIMFHQKFVLYNKRNCVELFLYIRIYHIPHVSCLVWYCMCIFIDAPLATYDFKKSKNCWRQCVCDFWPHWCLKHPLLRSEEVVLSSCHYFSASLVIIHRFDLSRTELGLILRMSFKLYEPHLNDNWILCFIYVLLTHWSCTG